MELILLVGFCFFVFYFNCCIRFVCWIRIACELKPSWFISLIRSLYKVHQSLVIKLRNIERKKRSVVFRSSRNKSFDCVLIVLVCSRIVFLSNRGKETTKGAGQFHEKPPNIMWRNRSPGGSCHRDQWVPQPTGGVLTWSFQTKDEQRAASAKTASTESRRSTRTGEHHVARHPKVSVF